jgi:hypothetical protein
MDHQTLEVYERMASELCARYRSAEPQRLQELVLGFFHPGEPAADVGSGSPRDRAWLGEHGVRAAALPDTLPGRAVRTAR